MVKITGIYFILQILIRLILDPTGNISIIRHLTDPPEWHHLDDPLGKLLATSDGKIEDQCMLQVDFANKFIGGTCICVIYCTVSTSKIHYFRWSFELRMCSGDLRI